MQIKEIISRRISDKTTVIKTINKYQSDSTLVHRLLKLICSISESDAVKKLSDGFINKEDERYLYSISNMLKRIPSSEAENFPKEYNGLLDHKKQIEKDIFELKAHEADVEKFDTKQQIKAMYKELNCRGD